MIADANRRVRSDHLRPAVVAVARDAALVDHAERCVREAEDDDRVVDVVELGEARIGHCRAVRRHLLDLADEPACGIEVVDGDVDEEAAGTRDVLHRRRLLVAERRPEEVDRSEVAGADPLGRRSEVGVEPTVEADLECDSRPLRRRDRREGRRQVERDRLLAEDVLACLGGGLDHRDVLGRRRRDHNGVDGGIGQQILVSRRPLDAELVGDRARAFSVAVDHPDELSGTNRTGHVLRVHEPDTSESRHAEADPATPHFSLAASFAAHPSSVRNVLTPRGRCRGSATPKSMRHG